MYHCLYACVRLSPSFQGTRSAHLSTSQSSKDKGRPVPPPLMTSFPSITTTQRKKVYLEPPQEVSQDSLPSELTTAAILPATSLRPDHLPSSQAPSFLCRSHLPQADSLCYGSQDLCPACDFRLQERSQAPGRNLLCFQQLERKEVRLDP